VDPPTPSSSNEAPPLGKSADWKKIRQHNEYLPRGEKYTGSVRDFFKGRPEGLGRKAGGGEQRHGHQAVTIQGDGARMRRTSLSR